MLSSVFKWGLLIPALFAFAFFFVFGFGHFSNFGNSIVGSLQDELSFLWIFDKLSSNILLQPKQLFDGGILFPSQKSLAFSETTFLCSLLYRAWLSLLHEKLLAYNVTVLSFFVLNFLSMYAFCRMLLRPAAAFLGGLIFSFSMVRLGQFGHTHILPQFFFPLVAVCIFKFEGTRKPVYLFLACIAVAGQVYTSVTLGMILLFTLIPYGIYLLWNARADRLERNRILGAAAILLLLLAPIAYSYFSVSYQYHFHRPQEEARIYSAHITNYLLVPQGHFYDPILGSRKIQRGLYARNLKGLFVGFLVLSLAFVGGIWFSKLKDPAMRKYKILFWVTFVFVIWMSLGPQARLYSLFYEFFPGTRGIRTPARLGFSYLFLMAFLAALGMERVLTSLKTTSRKVAVLTLFVSLFILENRYPIHFATIPGDLEGATEYLSKAPKHQPVLHLPFNHLDTVRMYYSLIHQQPLVNGYCGFVPETNTEFFAFAAAAEYLPSLLKSIRDRGVRFLVLEKAALTDGEMERWRGNFLSLHVPPSFEDSASMIFDLEKVPKG